MNEYLKKEAPYSIENPTVQGIAESMGITKDVLDLWLQQDGQCKEEMTNLKEFFTRGEFNDGTELDYFVHAAGVQFILAETKKRYTV